MPERPGEPMHEIVCPHCGKEFEAELMDGGAQRYRGFKCPHCRLFVAAERAEETEEERKAS
jgi:DNA-directed RNA polymerase subunit RPC12/RpoP